MLVGLFRGYFAFLGNWFDDDICFKRCVFLGDGEGVLVLLVMICLSSRVVRTTATSSGSIWCAFTLDPSHTVDMRRDTYTGSLPYAFVIGNIDI